MNWEKKLGLLIGFLGDKQQGSAKIAAFDLDSTLIQTTCGKNDNNHYWDWLYPSILPKLRQLVKEGFRIVVFTNQVGVASQKTNVEEIQKKQTEI